MSPGRFAVCLKETLRHEGGYVNHPKDPGGATNFGITRVTLAAWRKQKPSDIAVSDVRQLSRDEAADIYRARYWDICRCDELPAGVDHVVFDAAVNSGPRRSIKWLQISLGVTVNGYAGPGVIAAVKRGDPHQIIVSSLAQRRAFLRGLKTWKSFGRGWSRRLHAVEQSALAAWRDQPGRPKNLRENLENSSTKGTQPMLQTLIQSAFTGLIAKEMQTVGDLVLRHAVKDPKKREEIRSELSGEFSDREARAASELTRVATKGALDLDPWTRKARPTFLYVVYVMVFGAIPFGALYGFAPEFSARFAEGMKLFMQAIPDLAWYLFGSAYLGYSGLRSWDKKNGASSSE